MCGSVGLVRGERALLGVKGFGGRVEGVFSCVNGCCSMPFDDSSLMPSP